MAVGLCRFSAAPRGDDSDRIGSPKGGSVRRDQQRAADVHRVVPGQVVAQFFATFCPGLTHVHARDILDSLHFSPVGPTEAHVEFCLNQQLSPVGASCRYSFGSVPPRVALAQTARPVSEVGGIACITRTTASTLLAAASPALIAASGAAQSAVENTRSRATAGRRAIGGIASWIGWPTPDPRRSPATGSALVNCTNF